jgi:hypothetical protein
MAMARIPTRLLFLEDTYLFKHSGARVLSVLTPSVAGLPPPAKPGEDEARKHVVYLSETIFHPQGGSSPSI